MIQYRNQFKMMFSIGNFNDFLTDDQIDYLKIVEIAHNTLPEFEFVFKIQNSQILKMLNETNLLRLQMGQKEFEIDVNLKVYKKVIVIKSDGNYEITASGLLFNKDFLFTPQRRCFGNCTSSGQMISGLEVIAGVARETFKAVESNIEASQDYMLRIQPNVSNKKFIDELWKTLYVPESMVLLGITTAGKYKIRDVKKLSSTNPKWYFSHTASAREIPFKGDCTLTDESGVNNYLFGYIRQQELCSDDTGDMYLSQTGNSTMLSLSDSFNRDAVTLALPQTAINENLYTEYWEARATNLSNLALFSSVQYQLQIQSDWYPIEILDLAQVTSRDPSAKSEEMFSGLYVICAVSRIFKNKHINTVVGLNREGLNKIG